MKVVRHIGFVLCGLFLILGIPFLFFGDLGSFFTGNEPDALTGASLEVPDSPDGSYYILINKNHHKELDAWTVFFEEKDNAQLIFEDISCLVISSDANALELGNHFKARLPENQMSLLADKPLLAATKIETAHFDAAIVSDDAAALWKLRNVFNSPDVLVITKEVAAE